ncbi:MAG: hypothetical protein KAS22_07455 [Candidatus Heimdallarchaeota archaeon]|nr:hypothetical protein [Candidatus Heimdallarchaeota archaeon]
MEETKSWINYRNAKYVELLYKPFLVYGKQFLKFFIIALIPELIFFGVTRIVIFSVSPTSVIWGPAFAVSLDFIGDLVTRDNYQTLFFVLIIPTIIMFIYRSSIVSNLGWKTIETGKANLFWSLDRSFRKSKELFVFLMFIAGLIAFPALMIVLGVILQGSSFMYAYVFSWMFIIAAIVFPLIFYSKTSMFIAGMSRDNLHVGAAIQTSWQYSSRKSYYRVTSTFVLFLILGVLLPWGLSLYFSQIYGFWATFGFVFVKAFCYPLFDISLTLNYMNQEYYSLDKAVFRDAIIEQKKRSKEMIKKGVEERNL